MSAKPGRSIRPSQTSASLGASSVAPSRVHSPAEIDHDLEIAVEGEPQPGSLFKLAYNYACLFELAREKSLAVVERCAVGKLIVNCLLRQWRCNRASVAVPGVAVADQTFCSRQPRRFLRAPTPRLYFAARLGLGRQRQRLPAIQAGGNGGIRSTFFSISARTQITARSSRGMFTRSAETLR